MADARGGFGIGAAVEGAVLRPGSAHKTAHAVEVAALDGIEHFKSVGLHTAQQTQLGTFVEEHVADDLGENVFGCACDAGVVEQVTGGILRVGEDGVWEPVV